jgi:hypothetical protein
MQLSLRSFATLRSRKMKGMAVAEKENRSGKLARPAGDTMYRFAAVVAALAILASAGLF